MNKIEEYKKVKETANRVKSNYKYAFGLDSPNNDKHHAEIRMGRIWDSDIELYLHARYGFYGSSSAYTAMDVITADYFVKALNNHVKEIFEEAVSLAEKDTEKARLAAEEEAKEVLNLVKKD